MHTAYKVLIYCLHSWYSYHGPGTWGLLTCGKILILYFFFVTDINSIMTDLMVPRPSPLCDIRFRQHQLPANDHSVSHIPQECSSVHHIINFQYSVTVSTCRRTSTYGWCQCDSKSINTSCASYDWPRFSEYLFLQDLRIMALGIDTISIVSLFVECVLYGMLSFEGLYATYLKSSPRTAVVPVRRVHGHHSEKGSSRRSQ